MTRPKRPDRFTHRSTDKKGKWEIDGSFTAGNYHAEVAPKTVGGKAKKPTKCKGGKGPSGRY